MFFFVNGEYEESPSPIFKWRLSEDGVGSDADMISRVTAADMEEFASILRNQYNYEPGSYTDYDAGTFTNKILARIDWNINMNNKFTIRYNYTKTNTPTLPAKVCLIKMYHTDTMGLLLCLSVTAATI